MAIAYKKNTATFAGDISVEDAESLLEWLQKTPKARLDLAACTHLHAANLQVLMAARVAVAAWPLDTTLKSWLMASTGIHSEEKNG
jgi:anti-anti-sigma regulatory factor